MTAWSGSDVPAEYAVRGLDGVTLLLSRTEATAGILTNVLGLAETGREGSRIRYVGTADVGAHVTLQADVDASRGRQGAGSVHHLAFRAADDAAQAAMAAKLTGAHGPQVTEQRDRNYFRSVYFREPGGAAARSGLAACRIRHHGTWRCRSRTAGLCAARSPGDGHGNHGRHATGRGTMARPARRARR